MGGAILAVSAIIKFVFVPIQIKMQIQGSKMKLIGPETKIFQEKTKKLSQQGDYTTLKEERKKFDKLRKEHGLGGMMALVGLL